MSKNNARTHAAHLRTPRFTQHAERSPQLQLSCWCLISIPPVCSCTCQHGRSLLREFGWRAVVSVPRHWLPQTSARVCGQPNASTEHHKLETPKAGRRAQLLFNQPNARLNFEGDSRESKDPTPRSPKPNAESIKPTRLQCHSGQLNYCRTQSCGLGLKSLPRNAKV
jgi:hypothetical protein